MSAPTRSSDGSPTPTPTAEPEAPRGPNPANYDFGITAGEIQPFIAESQEAFLQRPIEERALVGLYYGKDVVEFAEDYYGISGNTWDDPARLPERLSVDNKPEEILAYIGAMSRIPVTLEDTSGTIDLPASERMLAAIYAKGGNSGYYSFALDTSRSFETEAVRPPSARSLAAQQLLKALELTGSTALYTNAQGYPAVMLNTETSDGSQKLDLEIIWVETAKGGTWVNNS